MWPKIDQRQKPWACYEREKQLSLLGRLECVAWDSYKTIFLPRRKPALGASAHRLPESLRNMIRTLITPLLRPALSLDFFFFFSYVGQFELDLLLLVTKSFSSHTKHYHRLTPGPWRSLPADWRMLAILATSTQMITLRSPSWCTASLHLILDSTSWGGWGRCIICIL